MKQSNPLGIRIQEGRKAAGLSQEQLGEQLGVSRQAVSKWESDAAIPELEKLIAMSRLFGVPVGTLLGVEPQPAPAEGEPSLTERELQAVEAIAARYAGTLPSSRPQKSKMLAVVLSALSAALVVALCVQTVFITGRLERLQAQVDEIQSSAAGQTGTLPGQISPPVVETERVLLSAWTKLESFDREKKTVTLAVSATPAEQALETTAVFTARLSDGRELTQEASATGSGFAAEGWLLPMDEDIQITVTLTDSSTVRTAEVDTRYDCGEGDFSLDVYAYWGGRWYSTGNRVDLREWNLTISRKTQLDLRPERVEFCLYRNQEQTPEREFSVENLSESWGSDGRMELRSMTGFETSFTLEPGETMACAVRVTDNYGLVRYQLAGGFYADANGTIHSLDDDPDRMDWTPGAAL